MAKGETTGKATTDVAADILPAADDDVASVDTVVDAADTSTGRDEGAERSERARPTPADEDRDAITRRFRELRDAGKNGTTAAAAADDDADPDDNDDGDGENLPAGARPAVSKPAAAKPAAAEDGEPAVAEGAEEPEITLIVDGKQVKKTRDEVIALAQITVAGDNRLSEAKRLLNEAKAIRANPENPPEDAEAQRPDRSAATGPKPVNQPAPTIDRAKLAQFAERIQVGDAEDGAAALEELVTLVNSTRPQGETLTREEVGQLFDQHQVQRETKAEIDDALNTFSTKFDAIAKDPDYRGIGLQRLGSELRADLKKAGLSDDDLAPFGNDVRSLATAHQHARNAGHKVRKYGEILTGIGNDLSAKFGLKPQPEPQERQQQREAAPSSAAQRRQDAKRITPQQPRTAGARVPAQAQTPRPKTALEKVNEMRQARGFSAA